jgi:hypothetical protein
LHSLRTRRYAKNDLPVAEAQSAAIGSGGEVALEIELTDPDSPFVSIFIDELPVQGTLYYDDEERSTSAPMETYTNLQPQTTEQYAIKILEASTFWPSEAKNWHPVQALGEGDAPFTYADSKKAACYNT